MKCKIWKYKKCISRFLVQDVVRWTNLHWIMKNNALLSVSKYQILMDINIQICNLYHLEFSAWSVDDNEQNWSKLSKWAALIHSEEIMSSLAPALAYKIILIGYCRLKVFLRPKPPKVLKFSRGLSSKIRTSTLDVFG